MLGKNIVLVWCKMCTVKFILSGFDKAHIFHGKNLFSVEVDISYKVLKQTYLPTMALFHACFWKSKTFFIYLYFTIIIQIIQNTNIISLVHILKNDLITHKCYSIRN